MAADRIPSAARDHNVCTSCGRTRWTWGPKPGICYECSDPDEGVLLWNLRQLLRWLEYGEFEPTEADKASIVAWINALSQAIKALEGRDG